MNETSDFGGWRKRRGQQVYEPKEGHPYVVALDDEGTHMLQTPQLSYRATYTGDNPVLLQTVPIPAGGGSKQALAVAQQACEEHWREQQTADSSVPEQGYFCQVDGEDLGDPQPSLEAAQALCQWHADTELVWREDESGAKHGTSAALGGAEDYSCCPAGEDERDAWCAWHQENPIGGALGDDQLTDADDAMQRCQAHYREQHPPPQAEPAEATPEPAATPGQLPPPQRADWVIPMPLTDEEMIEAFEEGRKLRRKRRRLQTEVAASAERHKNLVARNKELIGKLEDEIEALDESMPEKAVDCFRSYVRNGDEIWVRYSSPDDGTETLHERRLEQWEQRQLFGEGDPPPDKPPPPATEPPPDDDEPDPNSSRDGRPEHEYESDFPEPPTGALPPAGEPLSWTAATGEYGREYITGGEREGYTISRDPGTQSKAGKGGLLQIVYHSRLLPGAMVIRKLNGRHKKVEAAKEAAQQDNDTRLRWPEEWFGVTKLEAGGKYQLTQLGSGMVLAIRVGSLDEATAELGEHPDEGQAQQACQADADQRRDEAGG